IPIGEVSRETHCRTVIGPSCTRAVACSVLGLIDNTEQPAQNPVSSQGMGHLESVEAAPGPMGNPLAARIDFQTRYGAVRRCREQFVVTLEVFRQPSLRALGKNLVEEDAAAPVIERGEVTQMGFEHEHQRFPAYCA